MKSYVDNFRSVSILLLTDWFVLMVFQSKNLVVFGKETISTSWVLYCILLAIAFLSLDYITKFKSQIFKYGYIFYFFYLVLFNLAIINTWYGESPILNRIEHLAGSFVGSIMIYGLLKITKTLDQIPPKLQLLSIFAFTNLLMTIHEIAELALDYFFANHNIGPDLWDTNLDMLMNFLGISIFAVCFLIAMQKKGISPKSKG